MGYPLSIQSGARRPTPTHDRMNEPMLTMLLVTASAMALGICTSGDAQAPRQSAPPASNPLIAPWTGPYGGVPPWDKAKPELFPAAFEAALAEQRSEIATIVSSPAAPT